MKIFPARELTPYYRNELLHVLVAHLHALPFIL